MDEVASNLGGAGDRSQRAGRYVAQAGGYEVWAPNALPPAPPIRFDAELQRLLSDADRDLGRLDALTALQPDADAFAALCLRLEAVQSARIDGNVCTLDDLLAAESGHAALAGALAPDVATVLDLVRAMEHGHARVASDAGALSLALIRELHGEFRQTQIWVGGDSLSDARFVPPPPEALAALLADFERFVRNDTRDLPVLVRYALVLAQFEMISPFAAGNGGNARALAGLTLAASGALSRPLLYASISFNARRIEYRERLQAVRDEGDWEGWLRFVLRGVSAAARLAFDAGPQIAHMREAQRQPFAKKHHTLTLLDRLPVKPFVDVAQAAAIMSCSYVKANNVLRELAAAGLVREVTGHARNRVFCYSPCIELFSEQIAEAGLEGG